MENRARSQIFTPSESNLGGLFTVSTHLYKHKVALFEAKSRINSLQRPHPHVDEKMAPQNKLLSRPSSAKYSQYSRHSPNNQSRTFQSFKSGKTLYQMQFESSEGFKPIITRKNRKLDTFVFQKHTNSLRNLKLKIRSINSGGNTTERKKNPYDTGVHPALFFRKPFQNRKPMDYLDISARPVVIGNQRKLVAAATTTISARPRLLSHATTRTHHHYSRQLNNNNTFAMDSMDAEIYMDDNYKSSRQSSNLFDHLRKSAHRHNEF